MFQSTFAIYLTSAITRTGPGTVGLAGRIEANPCAVREIFGTEWNRNKVEGGRKCLKTWWPGTESNRGRQPFQGLAVFRLRVHFESAKVCGSGGLIGHWLTIVPPSALYSCVSGKAISVARSV